MTKRIDQTSKKSNNTFGGIIYPLDFERKITLSEITSRIASDQYFDELCKHNSASKKTIEVEEEENATC